MFHRDFLKESCCCCWLGKFRHTQLWGQGGWQGRSLRSPACAAHRTPPHGFCHCLWCLSGEDKLHLALKTWGFFPKLTFSLLEVLLESSAGILSTQLCSGNQILLRNCKQGVPTLFTDCAHCILYYFFVSCKDSSHQSRISVFISFPEQLHFPPPVSCCSLALLQWLRWAETVSCPIQENL